MKDAAFGPLLPESRRDGEVDRLRQELRQLVESVGLVVQRTQHVLPRRYPVTWLETKMVVWRALHGRAVPARRSCMVFELAPG